MSSWILRYHDTSLQSNMKCDVNIRKELYANDHVPSDYGAHDEGTYDVVSSTMKIKVLQREVFFRPV